MSKQEDNADGAPNRLQLAAYVEVCHREIHMLKLMVQTMAGMLNDDQRAILGEVISSSIDSYKPLVLKDDIFKQSMHEATSAVALGYETAIATQAAAWKRAGR